MGTTCVSESELQALLQTNGDGTNSQPVNNNHNSNGENNDDSDRVIPDDDTASTTNSTGSTTNDESTINTTTTPETNDEEKTEEISTLDEENIGLTESEVNEDVEIDDPAVNNTNETETSTDDNSV